MLRSLLGGHKTTPHGPTGAEEVKHVYEQGLELERGLFAMDQLMDGQVDVCESILDSFDGPFSKVAMGVLRFLEATMGMEPEVIQDAIQHLSQSESIANRSKDAAVSSGLISSSYRPGAQYEMVSIESTLLTAVCLFLNENIMDAAKALFKLRKAYLAAEDLRKHVEQVDATTKKTSAGALDTSSKDLGGIKQEFEKAYAERMKLHGLPTRAGWEPKFSLDEYIHSGIQACSGLIHLILSSIPSNQKRLLSFIGFSGERSIGMSLLWGAAEQYQNIHGCLCTVALTLFFDGPIQACDIELPSEVEDEISKKYASGADLNAKTTSNLTPNELNQIRDRLKTALLKARQTYPRGHLWLLLWSNYLSKTDIPASIEIFNQHDCGPNQIKTVEGFKEFELSMRLVALHRYQDAADCLEKLLDLSTWSHALYLYAAAGCYLELYRLDCTGSKAEHYLKESNRLFHAAANVKHKKKFLAKSLPFDNFVTRKSEILKRRAASLGLTVAEAAGTSPLHEVSYMWNTQNHTPADKLPESLELIAFSSTANAKFEEPAEEKYTRELLTAVYMRKQGLVSEALETVQRLLEQTIHPATRTPPDHVKYTKQAEPWAGPAALYERAILEWLIGGQKSAKATRHWLKLAGEWPDDYELSTRIGMRITSAQDRLDIYRL